MGHERLGILPKTKKWRAIVSQIATNDASTLNASIIAEDSLKALGFRYKDLALDESVRIAFAFLIDMAQSAATQSGSHKIQDKTPLNLVSELAKQLKSADGSLETREIVQRATADAIATWYRENSNQSDLFKDIAATSPWSNLGNGAGFCEISRLYFSKITERYLAYFLSREATSALTDLNARERFSENLRRHISDVSHHSFESAKITQSYAAGWFNKHAVKERPSDTQINRFLSYAFSKLREDFKREDNQ